MVDYSPIAFFIDWTSILNRGMLVFFETFNSSFTKTDTGLYVYSDKFEKVKIRKFFQKVLEEFLNEVLSWIEISYPKINKRIYLVGTCKINDNVFSDRQEKINLSYGLSEHDISMNMAKLEDIFDRILAKYFERKTPLFGKFIVVHHVKLCSAHVREILLKMFGKKHFIDCSEHFSTDKKILVDLNKMVDKNKLDLDKKKTVVFYENALKEILLNLTL